MKGEPGKLRFRFDETYENVIVETEGEVSEARCAIPFDTFFQAFEPLLDRMLKIAEELDVHEC